MMKVSEDATVEKFSDCVSEPKKEKFTDKIAKVEKLSTSNWQIWKVRMEYVFLLR